MDEIGTIPCPSDRTELQTFGVLDKTFKNMRFFARCPACAKRGENPRVVATVNLPFHIFSEALWDGAIWMEP